MTRCPHMEGVKTSPACLGVDTLSSFYLVLTFTDRPYVTPSGSLSLLGTWVVPICWSVLQPQSLPIKKLPSSTSTIH